MKPVPEPACLPSRRLERERRTLSLMIALYCGDHHGTHGALCPSCAEIEAYALQRLDRCPFLPDKPTCARCTVHCYTSARREQVREIMRYAGPRMAWNHPILAFLHLRDGWRAPAKAGRKGR